MADPELEPEDPELDPELDPESDPEGDPPDDDPETDPEPELDVDPEPEPDPEPQRQSRAAARIAASQAALRASRAETAQLKAAMDATNRQLAQQRQADMQRQQAEQLAGMDPDQRTAFLSEQRLNGLQRQIQEQQWALQENTDQTNWRTKVSTDVVAKKYNDRVEARLFEMRQNGQTAPRASVYYYLLGEDMATKGTKAVAVARANGKARVAAARGEPPRGRGNASSRSGSADPDSIEALEARLGKAVF